MLRNLITRTRPAVRLNRHSPLSRPLTQTSVKRPRSITASPPKTQSIAELLKEKEALHFARNSRNRTRYSGNQSAALALPQSTEFLARLSASELLEVSENHIIEHANRRVDLFFYTLVAYYQTQLRLAIGHTVRQHGVGRVIKSDLVLTAGCHSSIISSVLDETLFEATEKRRKSILSGTYFMDRSLNATVELPNFVNTFDEVLEKLCRPKCLRILERVAQGDLNPMEGLNHFLGMMCDALRELKKAATKQSSHLLVQHSWIARRELNPKLVDIVARGTLLTTFDEEALVARDAYIQSLLRINPEALDSCDAKEKLKLYLKKIEVIQDEILNSKSNASAMQID